MQVANPFANRPAGQLHRRAAARVSAPERPAGEAHVDKLEDTGQVVGDERVYKMEMTLNHPRPGAAEAAGISGDGARWPSRHKLFQGMTLPVRYAAENHDLLMVEWDKV